MENKTDRVPNQAVTVNPLSSAMGISWSSWVISNRGGQRSFTSAGACCLEKRLVSVTPLSWEMLGRGVTWHGIPGF